MNWTPDRSNKTLEELNDELRLYWDLQNPPETWRRKVLGWYSVLAFCLAIGGLIGCLVYGINWITAAFLAICTPGCWRLYQEQQRIKRCGREIESITAERARR